MGDSDDDLAKARLAALRTLAGIDAERKEIVERVKFENELIHQRLTWLGVFQGLLFAAISFIWEKPEAGPMVFTACCVGMLVAASIGIAINRANVSLEKTSEYWSSIRPEGWVGLDSEGFRSRTGRFSLLMPGGFIPKLFFVTWLAIGGAYFFFEFSCFTLHNQLVEIVTPLPNSAGNRPAS